ncbi:hypothetical protein [Mycolicibacterium sp. HK-90]|uniref:hypothetical protein n=1 Tax=Mycolicibacterium sp. HK-90 TaxID=3056937 RepID=UPI0026593FD4|nr:hypothetical protein [Mycolicibacterium sp. HK-90]WKG03099.1 hypothetical protein QU592_28590 [Mycolicibacterium sp. HK-90]
MPPIGEQKPGEEPPPEEQPQEQPPANPMDPSALISPVTDALSTLGTGLFEGVDPTTMLQAITKTFESTGGSLQQSVGSVNDAWQGESGTAAASKTTAAISDGAEVGAQSDALSKSLNTAAVNVGQARVRLIAIITEFAATIAAIGPMIIFPWGWAAAIAAANKAIATTAEVMTELQSSLATQAAQVTAAGAPVSVTSAPEAASLASLASPLMSMATKGAGAGVQAGTGAASAASQAAAKPAIDPAVDPAGSDPAAAGGAAALAGAGRGGGGGGIGAGGTSALRSLPMTAMLQAETASAPAQSTAPRVGGVGAPGMMGGGPYAPMGGQGANASSSNNHTSASFLHTTDQGSEIVGDLGTVAPPVLGEADPYQTPDVELRI